LTECNGIKLAALLLFLALQNINSIILDQNPDAKISVTRGNTSALELIFCKARNNNKAASLIPLHSVN
jgi:hypothetical protein